VNVGIKSKTLNIAEYLEWKIEHETKCSANHEQSAWKMEVNAIKEIFLRSEELHGVKYSNYIGNGDSKTYTGIINSVSYGNNIY